MTGAAAERLGRSAVGSPILVTGGSGFIGSHVCDNLRGRGFEVVSFDRHRRHSWRHDVEQFIGDIKDREAVFDAVARSAGVMHLAGLVGTAETVTTARHAVEANVLGALNVFDAVAHYRVPAVFIAVANWQWPSSYPISKHAAERFALMYNREFRTKIAVVRAMNAYGPRQSSAPARKAVPTFIGQALSGGPMEVYGDGRQVVDLIDVGDCAEILVRALVCGHGEYADVMEAGTGQPTTVLGLARLIWEVVHPGEEPRIEFLPMRPGEPEGSVSLADPATLRPLGWTPGDFTPLSVGLRRTIAWYQANVGAIGLPTVAP